MLRNAFGHLLGHLGLGIVKGLGIGKVTRPRAKIRFKEHFGSSPSTTIFAVLPNTDMSNCAAYEMGSAVITKS